VTWLNLAMRQAEDTFVLRPQLFGAFVDVAAEVEAQDSGVSGVAPAASTSHVQCEGIRTLKHTQEISAFLTLY
jgi:hypothetical protein